MVKGIEKFREHFAGHEDQYAIIGGAACDLLFGEAGLPFRATKDIDMVLCVEVVDGAFGERFSAFLDAGGYEARERSGGKKEFYRIVLAQTGDAKASRGSRNRAYSCGRRRDEPVGDPAG
jgi:hypothetical protein